MTSLQAPAARPVRPSFRSGGFSLIELLLAVTLGSIVTVGVVQLFAGNSRTYELVNGQSRMQESARYAFEFLSRSVRAAGYYGCDPDNDKIYKTLNGNWNQLFEFNITVPIEGFEGINAGNALGDWSPSLGPLPRNTGSGNSVNTFVNGNGIDVSRLKPESDVLVVRHAEVPGERIARIVQPTGDPQIEDDGDVDIQANDFVLLSNCEQAVLFRVTGMNAVAGGFDVERAPAGGTFANAAVATLSNAGIPYGAATDAQGSSLGKVSSEIYYVAQGLGTNNRNQTVWSLWRKTGADAPVELIDGIEDLQVQFGIDTTPNDGLAAANRYVGAGNVGVNAVRAVRLSVRANSVDTIDAGGQLVRRTFSQTVALRNEA